MMLSQQHKHAQQQRQRMSIHNTSVNPNVNVNVGLSSANPNPAIVDHRADSDIQLALQTELKVLAAALAIETSALHLHNEHHNASTTGNNSINGLSNLLDQLVNVCTVSRLAEDLDAGVDNVICALTEMSRLLLTTVSVVYLYDANGINANGNSGDNCSELGTNGDGTVFQPPPSSRGSGSGQGLSGRNHGNTSVDIMSKLHHLLPSFPMWFTGGKRFSAAFTHVHSLLERHAQGRPIDLQSLNDGLFAIRDACDVCYELLENMGGNGNAGFNVNGTMNGNGSVSQQRKSSLSNHANTHGHTGGDGYSRERVNSSNSSAGVGMSKKSGGRNVNDSRVGDGRRINSNNSGGHDINPQSLWEEHHAHTAVFNGAHAHMHGRISKSNQGSSDINGGLNNDIGSHGQPSNHNQSQGMLSSETSKMWAMGPSLLFTPPPTPEDASSPTIARSVHGAVSVDDSPVYAGGSKNSKGTGKHGKTANTASGDAHGLADTRGSTTASMNRNIVNSTSVSARTSAAIDRDAAAKAAFESAPGPDVMRSLSYCIPAASSSEYVENQVDSIHEQIIGGLDRSDSSELLSSDLINALDDSNTEEDTTYVESMLYEEGGHGHVRPNHTLQRGTGGNSTGGRHSSIHKTPASSQSRTQQSNNGNVRGNVGTQRKSSNDAYGNGMEYADTSGIYDTGLKNAGRPTQTQRQPPYTRTRNGSGESGKRGSCALPSNDLGYPQRERQPPQAQFGTNVIGGGFRTPSGTGSSGLHDNIDGNTGQGMHAYGQGNNGGFMTEGAVGGGSSYGVHATNESHAHNQDPSGFVSASAPASVVGSPAQMRRAGGYMVHVRNTHAENTGDSIGDGSTPHSRAHNGHLNGGDVVLNAAPGGLVGGSNPSIVCERSEYTEVDWYGSTVGTVGMPFSANQQSVPTPAQPTLSSITAATPSVSHTINNSGYAGGDSNLPWKERPTGFRVVMCRHMDSKGKCKKAGTCTFAHSQASLEKFRALYIPTEKCNYGAKCAYRNAGGCRYSHTPLEQHKSIKVYNAAVATSMKSKADS
ncbi:hypothetical protein SARC_07492 [Sphaeroforma arctica JP610]|uniref:C3H1-type domain-containing protein n=1 Tax=Sphaeroforma arctica JP610 TaxID=667725 RepID=A0A0L0FTK4_9EUKA|nr:hypothetical protein SARC_07492 [Sphaeroforma arctica JP610]KNC80140.1 hypothetical protein SARC_07492 [Sphaeroforma arctica JP610]|eukprot:XP_014154042.1 hypothetical protein SARC_07492 [Sphaeroforma arctica JP610]